MEQGQTIEHEFEFRMFPSASPNQSGAPKSRPKARCGRQQNELRREISSMRETGDDIVQPTPSYGSDDMDAQIDELNLLLDMGKL